MTYFPEMCIPSGISSIRVKEISLNLAPDTFTEMEINFEGRLQLELLKVCQGAGALGPLMPEVEEITVKWDDYAEQYMADAVRQIDDYPNAAIGWAAFIGMAVAQWWGTDWQVNRFTPYKHLYGAEQWDDMDDKIMTDILALPLGSSEEQFLRDTIITCAEKAISIIMEEDFEPCSDQAYEILSITIKTMFKIGAALQLHRMGWRGNRDKS